MIYYVEREKKNDPETRQCVHHILKDLLIYHSSYKLYKGEHSFKIYSEQNTEALGRYCLVCRYWSVTHQHVEIKAFVDRDELWDL